MTNRRSSVRNLWMAAAIMALGASPARALSVSPPRTEVLVPPGGETTAVLTISNPHSEAYDVEISEKPWFIYPANRQIMVPDWLKLPSKTRFHLGPGKTRDIVVTIRCPKEAVGELM